MLYVPFASVVVELFVPLTITLTPGNVPPLSEETVPVITLSGDALNPDKKSMTERTHIIFFMAIDFDLPMRCGWENIP